MVTWGEFVEQQPDLAEQGRGLLYRVGVGLAYLSTVRPDMGPRVHPMCPLLSDDGMFAFILPSPKQRDLRRDGRYAMHSFPCPDNEDAFYVTGRARLVADTGLRETLGQQFVAERSLFAVPAPAEDDALFEFVIDGCMLTRTTGHGDPAPKHTIWKA